MVSQPRLWTFIFNTLSPVECFRLYPVTLPNTPCLPTNETFHIAIHKLNIGIQEMWSHWKQDAGVQRDDVTQSSREDGSLTTCWNSLLAARLTFTPDDYFYLVSDPKRQTRTRNKFVSSTSDFNLIEPRLACRTICTNRLKMNSCWPQA